MCNNIVMSITFTTTTLRLENDGSQIWNQEDHPRAVNMSNGNAGMFLIRMGFSADDYCGHADPEVLADRLSYWFTKAQGCTGYDLMRMGELLALFGIAKQEGKLIGWS